jgi:hypothetical protein
MANSQTSRTGGADVELLLNEFDTEDAPRRRSSRSIPKWMKIRSPFSTDVDYVEIDGQEPIEAISADWSDGLVDKVGALCQTAPIFFDVSNASGTEVWGPAARGAIVVAIRGVEGFEEMTVNAASAGALALIVVDNEARWKNNWAMTTDTGKPPSVPAVLVSKEAAQVICSGSQDLVARIVRRKKDKARSVLAAAWPTSLGFGRIGAPGGS